MLEGMETGTPTPPTGSRVPEDRSGWAGLQAFLKKETMSLSDDKGSAHLIEVPRLSLAMSL